MQEYIPYAAMIVAVISFLIQFKLFVRPAELEKRLAEERKINDQKYTNKEMCKQKHTSTDSDILEIKKKVDQIYEILLKQAGLK